MKKLSLSVLFIFLALSMYGQLASTSPENKKIMKKRYPKKNWISS